MKRLRRQLTVTAVMTLGVMGTAVTTAAATPAPAGYVAIPDSSYVLQPGDVDLGAGGGDAVTFELSMQLRNDGAAKALAYAVSDPASPLYGRFLSADAFRQRFGLTDRQTQRLTDWLTGSGLRLSYEPDNHLLVAASGTARAASRTFRSDVHRIQDADGNVFDAPLTALLAPADVAATINGVIQGVVEGSTQSRPMHDGNDTQDARSRATSARQVAKAGAASVETDVSTAPPDAAFVNARPCSAYWGEKTATGLPGVPADYATPLVYAPCGYTPPQLAGAYGASAIAAKGITGDGVTVAVVDAYASPTIRQDIVTYAARNGSPAWQRGQFTQDVPKKLRLGYDDPALGGDACGEQGWYGEETLDIEAVHAMAPGADVHYVGASSCDDSDLLNALNGIIDGQTADIITNSWGGVGEIVSPELSVAYDNAFVQAAIQGIGVFFSSGDSGDEVDNTGARQADFPATNPWVTAVGGTSIGIGARNDYLFETGWGTTRSILTNGAWAPAPPGVHLYGAGGGTSQFAAEPRYQKGVVPDRLANYFGTGFRGRVVPDIAAIADPQTGFLVGQTQTFPDGSVKYSEYRIGGTSLSSPIMAGIEALADQSAGHAHGFANPAIYRLAGSGAVRDVVTPAATLSVVRVDFINSVDATGGLRTSLRTLNQTESLHTVPGYDDVTGIGSPVVPNYVRRLGR